MPAWAPLWASLPGRVCRLRRPLRLSGQLSGVVGLDAERRERNLGRDQRHPAAIVGVPPDRGIVSDFDLGEQAGFNSMAELAEAHRRETRAGA